MKELVDPKPSVPARILSEVLDAQEARRTGWIRAIYLFEPDEHRAEQIGRWL